MNIHVHMNELDVENHYLDSNQQYKHTKKGITYHNIYNPVNTLHFGFLSTYSSLINHNSYLDNFLLRYVNVTILS